MKIYSSNPKKLALMITSIVTVVIWLLISILYLLDLPLYLLIIIGVVVSAPIIYFVFFGVIDTFIYKKIKIIYKNIHQHKRGDAKGFSNVLSPNSDVLETVNKQVAEWAKSQRDEIDELKRMARYRREFIGNVSHELKTPIFNIQGYILTLLDGGIDDPEINRRYLKRSEAGVNRMIAIVNDLEAISALEAGVIELNWEKVNLIELAKEVIEFFDIKAKKKNLKITLSQELSSSAIVMADVSKIKQVFINLIDNAIKYSNNETPEIKIKFYDMDANILTEITDNGIGIKEHNIHRIFERFYRVDKGRSRQEGGTGLGLSIVKHIIEAHNQTINVRSKPGFGTTFGFTLKKA
jgi:two-component system phosphate regulon sensor histidine kinase PhoR